MKRLLIALSLLMAFIPLRAEVSSTEQVRIDCAKRLLELYPRYRGQSSVSIGDFVFYYPATQSNTPYFTMMGKSSKVKEQDLEKNRDKLKKAALKWIKNEGNIKMLVHDIWPNPGICFQVPKSNGEVFELLILESEYAPADKFDPAVMSKPLADWWMDYYFYESIKDNVVPYKAFKFPGTDKSFVNDPAGKALTFKATVFDKYTFDKITEEALPEAYFSMVRAAWQLLYYKGESWKDYAHGLPALVAAYQGESLIARVELEENGKVKQKKEMEGRISNEELLAALGDGEKFKAEFPSYAQYDPDFEKVLAMNNVKKTDTSSQAKIDIYCNKILTGVGMETHTEKIRDLLNLKGYGAAVPTLPGTMSAFVAFNRETPSVTLTITTGWYKFIDGELPTGEDLDNDLLSARTGKPGCMAIAMAVALKLQCDLTVKVLPNRFGGEEAAASATFPYENLVNVCSLF